MHLQVEVEHLAEGVETVEIVLKDAAKKQVKKYTIPKVDLDRSVYVPFIRENKLKSV